MRGLRCGSCHSIIIKNICYKFELYTYLSLNLSAFGINLTICLIQLSKLDTFLKFEFFNFLVKFWSVFKLNCLHLSHDVLFEVDVTFTAMLVEFLVACLHVAGIALTSVVVLHSLQLLTWELKFISFMLESSWSLHEFRCWDCLSTQVMDNIMRLFIWLVVTHVILEVDTVVALIKMSSIKIIFLRAALVWRCILHMLIFLLAFSTPLRYTLVIVAHTFVFELFVSSVWNKYLKIKNYLNNMLNILI